MTPGHSRAAGLIRSKPNAGAILLMELRSEGLPVPEAEHRFHPTRRWRLDFAYPREMVGIEIHGGVYAQGRHTRGQGFESDRIKMNTAQLMGWTILEFSTGQVMDGTAIKQIKEAMNGA